MANNTDVRIFRNEQGPFEPTRGLNQNYNKKKGVSSQGFKHVSLLDVWKQDVFYVAIIGIHKDIQGLMVLWKMCHTRST